METDTSITNPRANDTDLAIARATLLGALALAFRPPTEEAIARVSARQNEAALSGAAGILDGDGESGLTAAVEEVARAGRTSVEALSSSYHALFGHTARGVVPPYETEYGNEALFQQPQELGDLMGFYEAFGLTLKSDERERPDHISCECEFLAFLALKEAFALEHGDDEMRQETLKAQKLFLKDHLGRFLPAFARKAAREDGGGFYAALADLGHRLVALESARFNVTLGGSNMALRPADDDRVPMACGGDTDCAAMPGTCPPEGVDSA